MPAAARLLPKTCFATTQCVITGLLLTLGATAQTWTEQNDAGDTLRLAQLTRGTGPLTRIVGSTLVADERDAYCIKITDPAGFSASTDNAGTDFNTRLLLFGRHDVALLANDDVAADNTTSTLTASATDGSFFELQRAGEFVLVVTGFGEDATDAAAISLFDFASDFTQVHTADPDAGHLRSWLGDGAAGSYQVDLTGAAPCANQLDLVHIADGEGALEICRDSSGSASWNCAKTGTDFGNPLLSVVAGYFNDDAHLDVAYTGRSGGLALTRICPGDGSGGLGSCEDGPTFSGWDTLVVDVNGDQIDDLVTRRWFSPEVVTCTGLGDGTFPFCSQPVVTDIGWAMTVGYVNDDDVLDLIGTSPLGQNGIYCLGNESGGLTGWDAGCTTFGLGTTSVQNDVVFGDLNGDGAGEALFVGSSGHRLCTALGTPEQSCTDVPAATPSRDTVAVATADLDHDGDLDAVFGNHGIDRVCLHNGISNFTLCSDLDATSQETWEVLLQDLNGDGNVDLLRRTSAVIETCAGLGNGTFEACEPATGVPGNPSVVTAMALGEFGSVLFADGFESGDTSLWVVP